MNAHAFPIRAQSYDDLRDQRIEESRERAAASLARTIAAYEAATGKPFRDPQPTAEQIAQARQRADDAVRGLISGLVGEA
jgi:hypothetical protein